MNAPISDHVSVTIEVDSVSVARASFGIPMLLGYISTTILPGRVQTYTSGGGLPALVSAGYPVYHPIYKMAEALLGQNPKVESFKVGRLQAHTQDVEIEITDATEGNEIALTITDELGVDHVISYTILAAATTTTVATAVAALILAAVTNLTPTATNENIRCVADNAGEVFYYGGAGTTLGLPTGLNITEYTPDPSFATDLAAIFAEDDDWYGAVIDVNSSAIVGAVAAWIETQRKIFFAQSQDSEIPTSGVGDIATALQSNSYERTALINHHKLSLADYPAAAWMGVGLPKNPGSLTWAFKRLAGTPVSSYTATELTELAGKNANHYLTIAAANITRYGEMAGGQWIDRTRLADWTQARVEEALFSLMVNNDKLPYTNMTIDMVETEVEAVYKLGAERGGFVLADFTFSATAAEDQLSADRLLRVMRGIKFGGTFSDAVHKLILTGQIA